MEKLEGKYFEHTINKLKEAKNAERIEMRGEFKANLRAGLVEKIVALPMKADWSDAILRWKYLFGAVPALAVLTIVAANVANMQVKIPAPELIPQDVGQTVSSTVPANTVAGTMNNDGVEPTQSSGIVTFSSALVMPPADVLAKARAENQYDSVAPFPAVGAQHVQSGVESQPLNFLNDFNNNIKLNPPKVDLFTFDNKNTQSTVVTDFSQFSNKAVLPTVSSVPVQSNLVDTSAVTIPVVNVSPVDNSLRPENNARVENAQQVEPGSVNLNNQLLPPITKDAIQTDMTVPTATLQDKVIPINEADTNAKLVNPAEASVDAITAATLQLPALVDVSKTIVPAVDSNTTDVYVNAASEAMTNVKDVSSNNFSDHMGVLEGTSPTVLEVSRINYAGEDRPLINALVLRELSDRNGNLSGDYSVIVRKQADGKLKISLFEFGKVKRIVFMEMLADGQYKTVTVIDY